MVIIFRPLGDPGFKGFDLLRGEYLVGLGRRHDVVRIGANEPSHHLALVDFARREHPGIKGILAEVEAQIAFVLTRTMTFEAGIRENRPHIAIKIDGGGQERSDKNGQRGKSFHK